MLSLATLWVQITEPYRAVYSTLLGTPTACGELVVEVVVAMAVVTVVVVVVHGAATA